MPVDTFARALASRANLASVSSLKTMASAIESSVPSDTNYLRTAGFATAGDFGGALYRRVGVDPGHAGKFQSADGGWWEIAEPIVTPQMFGASTAGDATTAMQAWLDYCYNSGSIRAQAYLPPNCTFTVSDPNSDGYCLLLADGVNFFGGSAFTSVIRTTTAGKVILRRYRTGAARQGFLRDFCLDGMSVAKGCLELFGSAYDAAGGTVRCQNALRPVVIDAVQNFTMRGCVATNAGEWAYTILNGAGTVELDNCYARYARYGHVLIDNDPSYEGYQLGPAGGSNVLAHAAPTAISVRGGVYEDENSSFSGQVKASVRISTGARVLVYGNATLAIPATGSECHIDDGRWSLGAAYASGTSFTIASADVTAYFPVGRRVLCMDAAANHYSMPYGTAEYLSGTTFRVNGNQTAAFAPGMPVRLVRLNGAAISASVSSSSFSGGNTTVTISTAVVPTDMISAQLGLAYGIVSSASFSAGNTTINLTMDSGWTVPTGLFNVEIGRSDDGAGAFWYPTVSGTHVRDITLGTSGSATFTNSAVRIGSDQPIYDGVTLSGLYGDWFEISRNASIIKPNGSLAGGKLRVRHVGGIFSGFARISYIPNQQANSGVFELPGHATAMVYSSAGAAFRYVDTTGVWRIIPLLASGSGAPTFSASHVGQQYIDTTNSKMYVAKSTGTGASDWMLLN